MSSIPVPASDADAVPAISAATVKLGLHGGRETALLDVREHGEFVAGHPFLATSAPLSRFEPELLRLAPSPAAHLVLYDEGAGLRAARAARIARTLGYRDLAVMTGGAVAWRAAGYALFEGEHLPSKTFGELLQEACEVPTVSAAALDSRRKQGEKILLLDGRPFEEHRRMCIPDSLCLPNGDLAYRIGAALDADATPIVVHCAGRTRGIVGAQTLRNLELPNPIAALEDGTQGWRLAGLALEHGSERLVRDMPDKELRRAQFAQARRYAERWGVPRLDVETLLAWTRESARTTYLLDVRSPEEFATRRAAAIQNAPGGQLVQATDRWLAVRGARVVLLDDTEIRAVVTANWLRQMGWDAVALAGGTAAWPALAALEEPRAHRFDHLPRILPAELAALRAKAPSLSILDLRPSLDFRAAHLEGARWAVRAQLPQLLASATADLPVILVAADGVLAGLAAADLTALGFRPQWLSGDAADWQAAGLATLGTPEDPPDADRVDFAAFAHDRHAGNLAASREYLAWEKGLVGRLDRYERAVFKVANASRP
ncbi:MAG: rhodanese-like domain-containing protein [Dongiaceae bacterium]